jgi:hypothetical protein
LNRPHVAEKPQIAIPRAGLRKFGPKTIAARGPAATRMQPEGRFGFSFWLAAALLKGAGSLDFEILGLRAELFWPSPGTSSIVFAPGVSLVSATVPLPGRRSPSAVALGGRWRCWRRACLLLGASPLQGRRQRYVRIAGRETRSRFGVVASPCIGVQLYSCIPTRGVAAGALRPCGRSCQAGALPSLRRCRWPHSPTASPDVRAPEGASRGRRRCRMRPRASGASLPVCRTVAGPPAS